MLNSKNLIRISFLALLLASTSVSDVLAEEHSARTTTETTDAAGNKSWTTENLYWNENYPSRPYYHKTVSYKTIEPAYQYGYESYSHYNGKPFEEVESELRTSWETSHGNSTMTWEQVRGAVRDSYTRVSKENSTSETRSKVITNPDGSTSSRTTTKTIKEE